MTTTGKLLAGIGGLILASAVIATPILVTTQTPEVTVEAVTPPAVLHNQTWICKGPVDIDLVAVTNDDGVSRDAISLRSNCTGRIGRIEVNVINGADGVKVQNSSSSAAHDLVIEDGYVNVLAHPIGAHQDGLQIMGGKNITFQNLTCVGPGTALGCFAVSQAGARATDPTNIICDGCHLGPAKGLRIGHSISSGARNTVTCGKSVTTAAVTPVLDNVTVVPRNDPRCS